MVSRYSLKTLSSNDWRLWRELRLEALREAPHAFSAQLSDWQGAGDTEERWRSRLDNVPLNVAAFVDGAPAGMVGATAPDGSGEVELISLWVAPSVRGRGVGDSLVEAVIAWAQSQRARAVVLGVAASNDPATALYRRHGFADGGRPDSKSSLAACERRMVRTLS